ncbi:hypothetical protein FLLO111716_08515 [Flavobacterium longum]|uniref:hypothetical protein n=1 Tax=Flavobacterium longum TaxID=1299340 RepID=UPI0039E96CDE
MKKILCFLAIGALALQSCSSSSDDDDNASGVVLLKQTVETDADGSTFTSTATYNGTKINKVTSDGGYVVQFTYTGDLITKVEYKLGGVLFQKETYTYNGSGQLTSYVMLELEDDYGRKENYVYNGDGTISVSYFNGDTTSQTTSDGTGVITFLPNGEVATITTSMGESHIYTYDNKNNPFKNVTGYGKISFTDIGASGIMHNVVLDQMSFGADEIIYTYNADNYPTVAVEGSGINEVTTTFTYY